MSNSEVLQRLQQRADQADEIIALLCAQVEALKSKAVTSVCRKEEEKLQNENAKLKQDIENLKKRLTTAEINNGLKQVPLPAGGRVPAANGPETVTPVEQPKKEQKQEQNQVQEQGNKKAKKEKKEKPKKEPQAKEEALPIDVSRLDMRVGKIVDCKAHPDADSLYVEQVEVGEDKPRTIVSGIRNHVPLEEMQGKVAVFVLNLKPAKMRGILSEGMIMCASTPEKVEVVDCPPGCEPGDRLSFEGYTGKPDALLKPKQKIWEQVAPDLKVDDKGIATYKGVPFTIAGKGVCRAPTLTGVNIK